MFYLFFQMYCCIFVRSEHIPVGPFASAETRQISRRRTHSWSFEDLRFRKIRGLPKVLWKPPGICQQFGFDPRRQHQKNETFDIYAIGRDQVWNQIWRNSTTYANQRSGSWGVSDWCSENQACSCQNRPRKPGKFLTVLQWNHWETKQFYVHLP